MLVHPSDLDPSDVIPEPRWPRRRVSVPALALAEDLAVACRVNRRRHIPWPSASAAAMTPAGRRCLTLALVNCIARKRTLQCNHTRAGSSHSTASACSAGRGGRPAPRRSLFRVCIQSSLQPCPAPTLNDCTPDDDTDARGPACMRDAATSPPSSSRPGNDRPPVASCQSSACGQHRAARVARDPPAQQRQQPTARCRLGTSKAGDRSQTLVP